MIKKKRAFCLVAMFLVFSIICSMMLTVFAQTNTPTSSIGSWQPPKNFVDPVTLKIQEFKTQGLNNDQITSELSKLGMGWYPLTGATWMGRTLSAEELAKMPSTNPVSISSSGTAVTQQPIMSNSLVEQASCMRTGSYSWTGVSAEIVSGSMSVASGQTQYHYVCTQIGDLDGQSNWAETVVTHNLGENYKWYTYSSSEGGWTYYMDKNTPSTATDTYVIMLDGTNDGYGWHYDVWINYQWVRSGHLSNLWCEAGFQKEVYSSGQFTNDATHSVYYRDWLHNAQGWSYWTNAVNTWWSAAYPVHETHSMGGTSSRLGNMGSKLTIENLGKIIFLFSTFSFL